MEGQMWRILCVDDMAGKAAEVAEFFTRWEDNPHGKFEAVVETSFNEAIRRLQNERFDLVTLDLHGSSDPDPLKAKGEGEDQEGVRVLETLRKTRFVPVVFYTGFADKIAKLETRLVKVVKKGKDDLAEIRQAATDIFSTGLPKLLRHIEEESRTFLWDTVDHLERGKVGHESQDEISYLLARRLASRFESESIKALLGHTGGVARPIEFYIYPPHTGPILTGSILEGESTGMYWVVATPACDFAQRKADRVLLIGASLLAADPRHAEWAKWKWKGDCAKPNDAAEKTLNKLISLLKNNGGDRYRFLPGTFFLPNLVVDLQNVRQATLTDAAAHKVVCQLDSPFREDFLVSVSRYYGRIGVPDLEHLDVIARL